MKRIFQTLAFAGTSLLGMSAMALPPGTATTNTVTMAGASAQTPGIDAAMVAACTGGTLDRFSDDAPKFPGSNYSGWSCTLANANLGFAAGTSLKVIKRDAGGSLVGLQQPINSASPGLMIVDGTCTASTPVTLNGATTPSWKCAGVNAAGLADGGLSDVESNIWVARGQFTPAQPFTEKACAAQAFGVAVTNPLNAALQAAQGLGATDQPSLSTEQVSSLISDAGTAFLTVDWSYIIPGSTKLLQICRRTNTSGTNASAEIFFLANPCAGKSPAFGKLAQATQADFADTVWETSSTGTEKTCLNNAAVNLKPDGTPWGDTDHNFAIGFLSMENTPGAAEAWKFVKLNGVSPNSDAHQTANFEAGTYQFGFETTLFYANSLVAAKKTFFTKLCSAFGTPASAPKGLASVSTSGCSGANCMKYTRNGNSCQPWQ